jgi:hypothetical protein
LTAAVFLRTDVVLFVIRSCIPKFCPIYPGWYHE